MKISVQKIIVEDTIKLLQDAGNSSSERMVLWLGQRKKAEIAIHELLLPRQKATEVSIRIPQKGMKEIFDKVRAERLMVAAQVHSHPEKAFHSYTDDCLAVPRHEGAISLVLPNFAFDTTLENFFDEVACFRLSDNDEWKQVNIHDCVKFC